MARHLASLGLPILRRGFRTRFGEIDLVVEDGKTLVFVEVKARSSSACGRPAEAVDGRKRARPIRAAEIYLMQAGEPERPCRFDVAEVLASPGGDLRVLIIRDAFQAP